jgi:hypothetical protein
MQGREVAEVAEVAKVSEVSEVKSRSKSNVPHPGNYG